MGEFLMHSSVVWLNPHPSLGRMRKEPEMTVFGESGRCGIVTVAYLSKSKAKISTLSLSLSSSSRRTPNVLTSACDVDSLMSNHFKRHTLLVLLPRAVKLPAEVFKHISLHFNIRATERLHISQLQASI